MREEFVLHKWQLSMLDSRQWEQLRTPIGLAAAVKYHTIQIAAAASAVNIEAFSELPRQVKQIMVIPPSPSTPDSSATPVSHHDDGAGDPVTNTLRHLTSDSFNDNEDSKIPSDGVNDDSGRIDETWEQEYDEEEPDDEDVLERLLSPASPTLPDDAASSSDSQKEVVMESESSAEKKMVENAPADPGAMVKRPCANEKVLVETVTSDSESSNSSDDLPEKGAFWESAPTDKETAVTADAFSQLEAACQASNDAIPAVDQEESSKDAIENSREEDWQTAQAVPATTKDVSVNSSEDCDTTACESTDNEGDDVDGTDQLLLENDSVLSSHSEDMLGIPILTPASSADEDDEEDVAELIGSLGNQLDKHLWLEANVKENDDDATVVVSNVSPERKNAVKREREIKTVKVINTPPEIAETSTFESETEALQEILRQLPDKDHRNILSHLMIMTNARGQVARIKLAIQAKDALLASMEANGINAESNDAVKLIFHLARLKKQYRVLFGRGLFKAMSKLYKKAEKEKDGEVKRKTYSSTRRSTKSSSKTSSSEKPSSGENVVNETSMLHTVASF
jgi:hypothetical protein